MAGAVPHLSRLGLADRRRPRRALAQPGSLIGLWGLTFLSVAIFASPAVLIDGTSRGRKPWVAPVLALVVLLAMGAFGIIRLSLHSTGFTRVKLRIMQPNLEQDA